MKLALVALAAACSAKKPEPASPPRDAGPVPIQHVETCPGARATWTGERENDHDFYSTLTLTADGAARPITIDVENIPRAHWSFQIFSPDCKRVLLLLSRTGPFHVVRVGQLARYAAGEPPELELRGKPDPSTGTGAGNHRDGTWLSNTEIGWAWGCCDPPIGERTTIPPP